MDDLTRFQTRKHPGLPGEPKGVFALLYSMTGMMPGTLDEMKIAPLAEKYGCTSASMLRYLRKLKDFRLIDLERVRHGVWRIYVYHPAPEKRQAKPTPLFDWAGERLQDSGVGLQEEATHAIPEVISEATQTQNKNSSLYNNYTIVNCPIDNCNNSNNKYLKTNLNNCSIGVEKNEEKIVTVVLPSKETVKTAQPLDAVALNDLLERRRQELGINVQATEQRTEQRLSDLLPQAQAATQPPVKRGQKVSPPEKFTGRPNNTAPGQRAVKKVQLRSQIRRDVITPATDPKSEYLCYMLADMMLDGCFSREDVTSWDRLSQYAMNQARNRGGAIQQVLKLDFGEEEIEKRRLVAVAEWKKDNPFQKRQRVESKR